jgi:hypothetical protein
MDWPPTRVRVQRQLQEQQQQNWRQKLMTSCERMIVRWRNWRQAAPGNAESKLFLVAVRKRTCGKRQCLVKTAGVEGHSDWESPIKNPPFFPAGSLLDRALRSHFLRFSRSSCLRSSASSNTSSGSFSFFSCAARILPNWAQSSNSFLWIASRSASLISACNSCANPW